MQELKAMAASWGRSFLATSLTLFIAGESDPKTLILGGFAAVAPVILRWLNPYDTAFGRK
jgi:hypothetical protein